MTEREVSALESGNAVVRAALKILRVFNQFGVPWVVENPRTSYLWRIPELHEVARAGSAHF